VPGRGLQADEAKERQAVRRVCPSAAAQHD
jgi:hypothetical protein